jgi:hypothetical protein
VTAPVREEHPIGWSGRLDLDPKPGLAIGAVVTYTGKDVGEHGFEHVIVRKDDRQRYELSCRDYPDSLLTRVHPAHIHPTGEVVEVCTCGHEQGNARDYEGRLMCPAYGCPCTDHTQDPDRERYP